MVCDAYFRRVGFLLATTAALALQTHQLFAHTVSVGYENAGPGAVTFWYGTYHGGTNFTEGSLQLVGPGTNTTVPFTSVVQTKPAGLIDGTTNFYSNGAALIGTPTTTVVAWQGVTFNNLNPGTYTFTYIPIAVPTQTWQPIDNVILSSSVVLSALVLGGGSLAASASDGNQLSLATAIDNALAGGGGNSAYSGLASLTDSALNRALTEISGEAATGSQNAAFQTMNPFLTLMLDPFQASRSNNAGFGPALGYAQPAPMSDRAKDAYAAVTPKNRSEPIQHWALWNSTYGGRNTTSGNTGAGSHGSTIDVYGTAVGLDYRFGFDGVLGVALGAGSTEWGLSDGLGGGSGDVFQAGLYGSKRWGPLYLSASAAYAWHRMSTDRTLTTPSSAQLHADFDAHSFGGRLESGYRFGARSFGITPYAAVQAQSFHVPAYSERATSGSSAFALSYDGRTANDLRTELGGWIEDHITLETGIRVLLRARAAWAHDWTSDAAVNATFQTLPTATFTVRGAEQPKNTLLASLSGDIDLDNGLTLGGRVDGEFAHGSTTYVATASLRYDW